MSNPKLDLLSSKLLDIGKGNNLVSFKDTKSGTVEVLYPSFADLLGKAESSAKYEVFSPDSSEDAVSDSIEDNGSEGIDANSKILSRDEYLEKYMPRLHKKSEMLVYSLSGKPVQTIKKIHQKANSILEETGVNVAYIAFGFLHWKESPSSEIDLRAPILLSPITFENESVLKPYYVHMTEEDVLVNPTFLFKLKTEYGLEIQDISTFKTTHGEDGSDLFQKYLDYIESAVSQLNWNITQECKIGTFSFLKISMYQDIKNNEAAILANDNVRAILGEGVTSHEFGYSNGGTVRNHSQNDVHNIVDADSSQLDAIEMAKSGKSFVLQGPPGTGKSQTITNLIAECLNDDKKVLFVSEKMAALNVVFDKLKQAELEEFCLELHSHKANKKDVIANLCSTLKKPRSIVSGQAATEIEIKKRNQKQLDDYAISLHKQREVIDMSLYQLYELFYSVGGETCDSVSIDYHSDGPMYLAEAESLLEQYQNYVPSIGYDYRLNPWYGFIGRDMSYESKQKLEEHFMQIQDGLSKLSQIQKDFLHLFGISFENWRDAYARRDLFNFLSQLTYFRPSVLSCPKMSEIQEAVNKMHSASRTINSVKSTVNSEYDEKVYDLDAHQFKSTLKGRYSNSFSRLFNKDYRGITLK